MNDKYYNYLATEFSEWDELLKNLPYDLDEKSRSERLAHFDRFDKNGNVSLDFTELMAGFAEMGPALEPVTKAVAIVKHAFKLAKDRFPLNKEVGDRYIQQPEFRLIFYYMHTFFSLYILFNNVPDKVNLGLLCKNDFVPLKDALNSLVGTKLVDMDKEFH